ncbi:MAG TPA: fibronectin type III domain-containing protein [Candidatus Limnocylindrales bacterium]|nr:fibronectin type III domain-containing protein [Candidatus Limnocylindrales bacterium]
MPAAGESHTARDLVMKLGSYLADLTSNRSAAAVHADIVERLSEPDHDPRLARVADIDRYISMWAALRSGVSLPEEAWQCLVLPAVLAFSSPNDLKSHLELATSLWMRASAAMNGTSQTLIVAGDGTPLEPESEPVDSTAPPATEGYGWLSAQPSVVDVVDGFMVPAAAHRPRRAVVVATVVAVLIAAAVVWWTQGHREGEQNLLSPPWPMPAGGSVKPVTATPDTSPQGLPTASQPLGGTTPTPLSTQPVPAPTWNGSGPIAAPTAPQDLTVITTTGTSVALTWRPPADAGTGGLAYYRVWRDGSDAGWTAQTGATVTGLTPATTYTFTVTAHNGAGAASPPSDPVTAATRPSQPQSPAPPPTPPPTGPPPVNTLLATEPPQKPINLGRSFTVTGAGWPCSAPSTINLYLGGRLIATPDVDAQGAFRTTVLVDPSQPDAPTVAVIGSAEPLILTRGVWVLAAQLPAQPSCSGVAQHSIQIEFRSGPG